MAPFIKCYHRFKVQVYKILLSKLSFNFLTENSCLTFTVSSLALLLGKKLTVEIKHVLLRIR